MLDLRRRQFLTLLGGAFAWPLAARAQQPAMPVIGLLSGSTPVGRAHLLTAFLRGLRESGYVEGENVALEYRWAQDHYDRLPDLAADLVRRRVAMIAAIDTAAALAAKAGTTMVPVIFASGGDPVREGLVASLSRPGGNVTGVSFLTSETGTKLLGLLLELVPGAVRIAALADPKWPITEPFVADLRAAAAAISKPIDVLPASTGSDIDAVFASFAHKPVDALVVGGSALTNSRRVQITTLAAYHRVPTVYSLREFVEVGGLMSYGASITDAQRQAGIYAGRILKGQKPADLPVMQSTKFEFVINLNTARALGLTVPPGVLAIADEVME
jgi:putative tryptophan/tyrosine transport system substrate-binding protein